MDNPDVLLIEGYKEERGEKVVLLRDEGDWDELKNLQDIKLVVRNKSGAQLDSWLLRWMKEENDSETV